jgi:predicted RNA methylase
VALELDQVRLEAAAALDSSKRAELGQFMTPTRVARFMASLFASRPAADARLLDAGAGVGSLSAAFLDRWASGEIGLKSVSLTAYEMDDALRAHLARTLADYGLRLSGLVTQVRANDFVEDGLDQLQFRGGPCYTHAILNPPYKKIGSRSRYRLLLRHAGIETVNLYTGFVALALALLQPGGQMVAIIPRSFCNGPYYRPFRDFMLDRAAIQHLHLFASRDKAFSDDDVLQENTILLLERGAAQGDVTVSTSTDDTFTDYATQMHPFDRIVLPGDVERFIHIPTTQERTAIETSPVFSRTLKEIGVEVSTGPVVDFRAKEYTRALPEPGSVPLLYPCHFTGQAAQWPKLGTKKPNAIMLHREVQKLLYPKGLYVVVRRFSSKEEPRRIMASVVRPELFEAPLLGFENHLNVFHAGKHGLPEELVYGLALYLDSTAVDQYFRRFNGHTQVNATDLRSLKYPSRDILIEMGRWARRVEAPTQAEIDRQLERIA